jgi:hypothetical protein
VQLLDEGVSQRIRVLQARQSLRELHINFKVLRGNALLDV